MNRRGFLGALIGGVAATAAVRSFPFRVFSFPEKIVIPPRVQVRFIRAYNPIQNKMINRWDAICGFSFPSIPKHIECGVIAPTQDKAVALLRDIGINEKFAPIPIRQECNEMRVDSFEPIIIS